MDLFTDDKFTLRKYEFNIEQLPTSFFKYHDYGQATCNCKCGVWVEAACVDYCKCSVWVEAACVDYCKCGVWVEVEWVDYCKFGLRQHVLTIVWCLG